MSGVWAPFALQTLTVRLFAIATEQKVLAKIVLPAKNLRQVLTCYTISREVWQRLRLQCVHDSPSKGRFCVSNNSKVMPTRRVPGLHLE